MDTGVLQSMFTTLPVDLVASVLFATFVTVVTLRYGASLAIAFSLSIFLSHILFTWLPSTYLLSSVVRTEMSPYASAGIYGALVLVCTFILLRATSSLVDDSARPMLALLTGAATTVILLVVWHMSPLQGLWTFNDMIKSAFGEPYRLYWVIVAFTMFAFVKS
jgi:hypothetical protein